ncbi:MAG TPA: type II toxin-antitoxin system RelE/ParE family toxin [Stellaceae bacterium]|nr:type II toxin-antitoxin system RelE/ParE family toxin [Stellaceae bacterium]
MKRLPAAFYRSASGREPVRLWLKSLDAEDRKAIGDNIRTVEFGWPVGMPVCRPMGQGLFEVRSDLSGGRIARVLFAIDNEQAVLLHGFIKKTRKTPLSDLETTRRRLSDLKARTKDGSEKRG